MARGKTAFAFGCLLAIAGCYSPSIVNGGLTCGASSACPDGYHCDSDNHCWKGDTHPGDDMAVPASGDDMTPPGGGSDGGTTVGPNCTSSADCASGMSCVDGFCCNSTCSGTCEACDVSGSEGICTQVLGPPHGARGACGGSGDCAASCTAASQTACTFPPTTTPCNQSCSANTQSAGSCDATGACGNVTTKACANGCGPIACNQPCAVDSDCVSTSYCSASGTCAPYLTLTVNKNGSGTVSDNTQQIICGLTCSHGGYKAGAQITLNQMAASGYQFTGWMNGGCSGTGSCIVTLNADTTVTANFGVLYTLTLKVVDDDGCQGAYGSSGTMTANAFPACTLTAASATTPSKTCPITVVSGTAVNIALTPASGSLLDGPPPLDCGAGVTPTGTCTSGSKGPCDCAFTMSGNRTVTGYLCAN